MAGLVTFDIQHLHPPGNVSPGKNDPKPLLIEWLADVSRKRIQSRGKRRQADPAGLVQKMNDPNQS